MPLRQSRARERAAAWTALDSATPRIPTPVRGSFALVLKLIDSLFSAEPPVDMAVPPAIPDESGVPGTALATSTVLLEHAFAVAVDAAEMRAAADEAPLLEQADAGRSSA